MEDFQIVELYWSRNEQALEETARKYGAFCRGVAENILSQREDAEECVSDAYRRAWDSIPPQRPERLGAWLGKVTRNLALSQWRRQHAQKRFSGMDRLFSELEDCVPSPHTVERELDGRELTEFLNRWLATLDPEDRKLFLRRYWNGLPVKDLARERGELPGRISRELYRLRQKLKAALEKEEFAL